MIGISGCLLGKQCRYDGSSRPDEAMIKLAENQPVVVFCPECMARLKVGRAPAEIQGGDGADVLSGDARVVDALGNDVTAAFIDGAQRTLARLSERGVTTVYLKSKSPSCGVGRIYDGSFTGTLRPGDGVTAALLRQRGFTVVEV